MYAHNCSHSINLNEHSLVLYNNDICAHTTQVEITIIIEDEPYYVLLTFPFSVCTSVY